MTNLTDKLIAVLVPEDAYDFELKLLKRMTSANIIEYTIFDKNNKKVGGHRQNVMCMTCNDGMEKFQPYEDFTIQSWGYDENEEEWENEQINLKEWLIKNPASITFKKFNVGDIIEVKKLGQAKVIDFFDIFKKDKNWFPMYNVELSTGEIIEITQNQIKPNKLVKDGK